MIVSNPGRGAFSLLALFLCLSPWAGAAEASAQDAAASSWFPQTRAFRGPLADPLEPGLRALAVSSDLFRAENGGGERPPLPVEGLNGAGRDFHGVVTLGENFPLVRISGDGVTRSVTLGILVGATTRFRLTSRANDMVASDWVVGLPVEAASGPWSGRLLLFHRSAHLGDEIMRNTGARRVGYGHEGLSLVAARRFEPGVRAYAGGSWIFRSETEGSLERLGRPERDRTEIQGGLELEQALSGDLRQVTGLVGFDLKMSERTDWHPQWSLLGGGGVKIRGRSARVVARFLRGPSMHGEFFLTHETAWGVEVSLAR
jgi:hypothetical protein